MGKVKATEIRSRWTKPLVRGLNPELLGVPLGLDHLSSKVETIVIGGDRFVDLRGYPFEKRFKDVALDSIDFSFCTFVEPAGFSRVTSTKCRFVGGSINGSINGSFADCRFDGCSFISPIGWPETRFIRCSFEGASFRGGDFNGTLFEECSFCGCKMPRTAFVDCRFDECDFTDAVFRNGTLGGSTISRARNNFKYADPNNFEIKYEFVANPSFPTIDLDETSTVGTVFQK